MKLQQELKPQGPLPPAGQPVGPAVAQTPLSFAVAQAPFWIHRQLLAQLLGSEAMRSSQL
jgi:hypothetical protein